ncbi:MAG: nuclear transport factor 2 family protein [Caldilineaceae bacterium]|nr:nuclear transport factor 2 family protein [Caldilineaceae bacterium]
MTFQQSLTRHLKAIQNRDLNTFLKTIANDGRLTLIMPNGSLWQDYDDIAELHREWFADPDWQMTTELLTTHEAAEMASALLLVNYTDVDMEGAPVEFEYYLHLLFAKEGDQWLVIHDQNTTIEIESEDE